MHDANNHKLNVVQNNCDYDSFRHKAALIHTVHCCASLHIEQVVVNVTLRIFSDVGPDLLAGILG